MFEAIIYLAVFIVLAALVWWLIKELELPEPIAKAVRIVFVVVCVFVLIGILLNLTGHGPLFKLR